MKDRYLFRGKDLDGGGWLIGTLTNFGNDKIAITLADEENKQAVYTMVNCETINQCTGVKDIKGNLIFEGDIVSGKCGRAVVNKDPNFNAVIQYEDPNFNAVIQYDTAELLWGATSNKGFYVEVCDVEFYQLEVIGNIHDNPQLMEQTT